jgi:hypothetical protein
MLCHLSDSFEAALGERYASSATGLLQRTLIKRIALYTPVRWPKGVPTRPEVEQGRGGTPPVDFELDRLRLVKSIERFTATPGPPESVSHPAFGPMTRREWMRWGYLHTDHHLRQFGV